MEGGGGGRGEGNGEEGGIEQMEMGEGGGRYFRRERGVILAEKKQDENVKDMDRLDYI